VCRVRTPATIRYALARRAMRYQGSPRVAVTNRGLRAHAWSRRLGEDSISLWQKMKELIGMPTS
jgi:hypothetical protein